MTVLLRKLTRRSILDFGRYHGISVGKVLELKAHRYLRWVYFNCSRITFFDDILEEINIPSDWHIEKPGKDPVMGEALNSVHDKHYKGTARAKFITGEKGRSQKRSFYNHHKRDKVKFSKGSLQRGNQGHK